MELLDVWMKFFSYFQTTKEKFKTNKNLHSELQQIETADNEEILI
jgi:hypothetical protein